MNSRLLFLTERYPPDLGGVATSAGRISSALAGMRIDLDIVCWSRGIPPGEVVREDGTPCVYRMGRHRQWDMTMPHTLNLLDWLHSTAAYDAVWGHYLAPAGFLSVWFANLNRIRSTVSIRGNDIDRDMFPPGDFGRLGWTLAHADSITTVSRDLERKVAGLSGRDDIVVLRNAVDADVFAPAAPDVALRASLGIAPDEVVLGFAGELREKKGQQHLLDALRAVQARRPACLLVIGEVRPSQMPWLMQFTGYHEPAHARILITGQLPEPARVAAHMHLCDVFLQPSLWDGMPNALLEAMACGLGVIGSDAGGIPEVIRSGVDGIILPRWQLHRLGEAVLEWLAADSAMQERMREAARARVLSEFNADRERAGLQTVLDRLIPSSS